MISFLPLNQSSYTHPTFRLLILDLEHSTILKTVHMENIPMQKYSPQTLQEAAQTLIPAGIVLAILQYHLIFSLANVDASPVLQIVSM